LIVRKRALEVMHEQHPRGGRQHDVAGAAERQCSRIEENSRVCVGNVRVRNATAIVWRAAEDQEIHAGGSGK
jgi:hypothetical protein